LPFIVSQDTGYIPRINDLLKGQFIALAKPALEIRAFDVPVHAPATILLAMLFEKLHKICSLGSGQGFEGQLIHEQFFSHLSCSSFVY